MSGYDLPPELQVDADGPVRVVRLNRPEQLNATNHTLHDALARVWPQIDADGGARAAVLTGAGRAFSAGGDFSTSPTWPRTPPSASRAWPTRARS